MWRFFVIFEWHANRNIVLRHVQTFLNIITLKLEEIFKNVRTTEKTSAWSFRTFGIYTATRQRRAWVWTNRTSLRHGILYCQHAVCSVSLLSMSKFRRKIITNSMLKVLEATTYTCRLHIVYTFVFECVCLTTSIMHSVGSSTPDSQPWLL